MKRYIVCVLVVAFGLTSCERDYIFCKKPDGETVTEKLNFSTTFSRIDLELPVTVYISKDENFSVEVTGPSDVVNDFKKMVDNNGFWHIDTKRNWCKLKDVIVYIHTDEIDKIHVSGSGDITMNDVFEVSKAEVNVSGSGEVVSRFETEEMNVTISGSGEVDLSGHSDECKFKISGSGDIQAYDFEVKDATTNISGSGNMKVHASEKLDVNISGSGDVYYKGIPKVNSSISGSGSVKSKN